MYISGFGYFQALPSNERKFSYEVLPKMLRYPDVRKIRPALKTTKMLVFPFYYVPDKQFLLAVVQPGIHRIHFLDTIHNSNRQQFFSSLFPIFLCSYLEMNQTTVWDFTWHGKQDANVTTDSAIFVCVYMYIIMELDQRQCIFDNILPVVLSIYQQPCMKRTYDRRLPCLYYEFF